jgi:hypothetical protein
MNPDVFITIVFAGVAVLTVLVVFVFVVPNARREDARVARREQRRTPAVPAAEASGHEQRSARAKEKADASVE